MERVTGFSWALYRDFYKLQRMIIASGITVKRAFIHNGPKLFKNFAGIEVNSKETDCFFLIIS